MKKRLFAMSCIAVCAAVIFSGCNVIKTEISNPITEIFDESGIDYKSFSEPAQQALYRINSEHFFEAMFDTDEEEIADTIEEIEDIFFEETSNSMEVAALTNAVFEDLIIRYDISVTNSNAAAVLYAAKKYCNECSENDIAVKSGVHIYSIASKSPEKAVKYNGSDRDLQRFIDDVINVESRNGYCYININEYGVPIAAYWADDKSEFENEDELKSYYIWNIEDYQNGGKVIGFNSCKFNVTNTITYRTIEKTTLADSVQFDTERVINSVVCDNLTDIFIREIDEWNIEKFSSSVLGKTEKNNANSITEEQEDNINRANAQAKMLHTAVAASATQAGIYDIKIENSEITNKNDGDTYLPFGDFDLKDYLGDDFSGYYYVYLNTETYSVRFALWSEQPIPDSYKYQLTEDEQKELWAKDIRIGCYPLAVDKESAYSNAGYSDISTNSTEKVANVIDPFENLEIEFDGASPYLKASVNTLNCRDEVMKYVTFSVTDEPLKNEDTVTVNADWDEGAVSDQNLTFSAKSKDYKIENEAYYLKSLDGVDLSELKQLMDDYVEAEANKSVKESFIFGKSSHNESWYHGEHFTIGYNPIITGIGSYKVINEYMLSLKQPTSLESDKIFNKYICIYEVNYNTYREATDESASGTAVIAVFVDNIVMEADGSLKYNSTENLSADRLYYKSEDTVSIIESNYVIAEKAKYNVTQIK